MKKNIGPVLGLYPTPVTVLGTEAGGKVNWITIAHVGIIGLDRIILSMNKSHASNKTIKENRTVSVNLVDEEMLIEVDYIGLVSGSKADKSDVFEYYHGELKGAPLIKKSPLSMECEVVDIYETEQHESFIVKPVNTYVDENMLSADGSIDYEKVRPVLFEMPNRQYMSTGKVVGKCWSIGNEYKK
jgi:flavin reductase (DIM6/NTAB) family NADH-FMN oxidoreductase RutF